MAKSKGFMLYHDMLDSFARLDTDSERWQLLTALIHYSANDCQDSNDDYSNLSPMAQGMYIAMTAPIRAQYQQYEKICERNRSNRTKSDDNASQSSSPVVPVVPNAPVVPVVPNAPVVPVVTNKQNKINKQNKQTKSVCQNKNKTLTNNWGASKAEVVANLKNKIKVGEQWNYQQGTIWDTLADEIIDIIADRLILSAQGPYVYEGTTYDQESTAQLVSQLTPGILHSLLIAYKLNKARVRSPERYIWSAVIDQVRQLRMRQVPTQSADNSD